MNSDCNSNQVENNPPEIRRTYQRLNQPPYPYNEDKSPITKINGHYYCLDSNNSKGNPKSLWTKKYIYYHTCDGVIRMASTDNIVRHRMNEDSKIYGDIGIIKIKHYIGLDYYQDKIIYKLLKNNMLPKLEYNPNYPIEKGLDIISPDRCITRFSRKNEATMKNTFGTDSIRLIFWDTETTGTRTNDRIVEIGLLDIISGTTYCKQFNPDDVPMSEYASKITGITSDELKLKPKMVDYLDEIEAFIKGDGNKITIMVAHNSNFDENMLRKEYIKNNRQYPPKNTIFIDSLEMCKTWISGHKYDINEYTKKALKGVFKLSTNELDAPEVRNKDLYYRYFNKPMEGGHNSVNDIIGLYNVVQKLFHTVWGRNEYWFMNKKMLELHFISEILDTPYILSLLNK